MFSVSTQYILTERNLVLLGYAKQILDQFPRYYSNYQGGSLGHNNSSTCYSKLPALSSDYYKC